MTSTGIGLLDLARDPLEVARELQEWRRGDTDEAVAATLGAAARQLHGRDYTLWVWAGRAPDDAPAWLLPVPARTTERFAPRGQARALLRCLDAAALHGGADPEQVRLEQWRGFTCLVAPGMDEEFAAYALAELHPPPSRVAVASLPAEVRPGGRPIPLEHVPPAGGEGIVALAHDLAVHPVRVALTLIAYGQPADAPEHPPELVASLREWGCVGERPAEAPDEPRLAISDDPCPLRRHARKVLQRLLRMGKVGPGYHTEFDHLYRGAPADARDRALAIGAELVRAGLLGEKRSVGQRHVYLRRESLPEIHALIERGETTSTALASMWTAPAPTAAPEPSP
jgi:hypothetical protein